MDIEAMIENDELESALFEAETHPETADAVMFDSTLFSQEEAERFPNQRDTSNDYRVNCGLILDCTGCLECCAICCA